MRLPTKLRESLAVALLGGICLLFASACATRLIGDYDDVIDRGITDFQTKVEAHLISLESASGTAQAEYRPEFYDAAEASLNAMASRARASFKKDILAKQLDNLCASIENLRKLHKSFGATMPRRSIETARSTLRVQVESILRLELALRRGRTAGLATPPAPVRIVHGE
jgi:hypothetical protein